MNKRHYNVYDINDESVQLEHLSERHLDLTEILNSVNKPEGIFGLGFFFRVEDMDGRTFNPPRVEFVFYGDCSNEKSFNQYVQDVEKKLGVKLVLEQ